MHHYRTTLQHYTANLRKSKDSCPFCDTATVQKSLYKNDSLYVVENITQYDLWEMHDVIHHLLIVPNRHVESLSELIDGERLALMAVAADYEQRGYNVYARGVGFITRSVRHQHTHLIKASNKTPRAALFLQKPYMLIKR